MERPWSEATSRRDRFFSRHRQLAWHAQVQLSGSYAYRSVAEERSSRRKVGVFARWRRTTPWNSHQWQHRCKQNHKERRFHRRLTPGDAAQSSFIKRHPLLTYYGVTFAILWGALAVLVAGWTGILPAAQQAASFLPVVFLITVAGPAIAGLVLTGLVDGRKGFRDFAARLRWRVGWVRGRRLRGEWLDGFCNSQVPITSRSIWGSRSRSTTFLPARASSRLRYQVVVVLPTPPFRCATQTLK